jgi:protein-S-isoprenylcysteine O-methyltransferase Ste14
MNARALTLERAANPVRRRAALVLTPGFADNAARVALVGLFSLMAVRIAVNFQQTGRVTGLLLLASELLVVVFTLIRRPAIRVDRSSRARLLTALSMLGPPLVRPGLGPGLVPELVTAAVSVAGLAIVVSGKISLGRSFGLMPANRGIVCSGVYRFVRHPIYAGYLVTHVAFLFAHPSGWNVVALMGSDLALMFRAMREERTLVRDPQYASYCDSVRWRICPGLF